MGVTGPMVAAMQTTLTARAATAEKAVLAKLLVVVNIVGLLNLCAAGSFRWLAPYYAEGVPVFGFTCFSAA